MPDAPDITHVIPAHNEERFLPRTLESVRRAVEAFDGTVEVIVVDNVSTDDTAAVARGYGATVVREETRRIAAVRNAGAAAARGRILTFADADSMVSENFFVEAHRLLSDDQCIGGNFEIRPDRTSAGIRFCVWFIVAVMGALLRVGGGAYFCLRETFEAFGGFDARRDYAEDVAFARVLRRYGKARGKHYVRSRDAHIVTSMRKADALGDWHAVKMMAVAPFLVFWPPALRRMMRKYFYEFDRSRPSKGFE